MNVRGAPLIAIVAVLALSVHLRAVKGEYTSVKALAAWLETQIAYMRTSRPTAVNLFTATDDLRELAASMLGTDGEGAEGQALWTVESFTAAVTAFAGDLLAADVVANRAMGAFGAERILARADGNTLNTSAGRGLRVLTICNTGSLACAGYGTALGVCRALHERGRLEMVFACETRPYNQGARLTCFELVSEGIPGTLIADSMAAALMATKGVDCVIVGADRVAANGDTANKIGTYQLAIAAKHHQVPFYVAASTTSMDVSIPNGSRILVEERAADELTCIFGQRIAPEGIAAWNPAFDVTPCELITGIITEIGIIEGRKAEEQTDKALDAPMDARIIDVGAFLKSHGQAGFVAHHHAVQPTLVPVRYRAVDEASISALVADTPAISSRLGYAPGDAVTLSLLHITEVGDGNLNYVYIVKNPSSGQAVVIKQALPYVRCVGDSWPLSLSRATFEHDALVYQRDMCVDHVPEVYFFDQSLALMAMEYIPAPHIVLRKVLIRREKIDSFAGHVATFMAKTLFKSSFLALSPPEFRKNVAKWSANSDMCALTEQVIFTDPFAAAKHNSHTPGLDDYVHSLRSDAEIKLAAADLKTKFVTSAQALLHGDLHTGSVMVAPDSTYVIDPEFAFMGPIGFDTGSLLANLFLSYFSQPGHRQAGEEDDTHSYSEWILQQIVAIDDQFNYQFTELWRLHAQERVQAASQGEGEGEGGVAFDSPQVFLLDMTQRKMLRELWWDTLGFAGIEMLRRLIGIAHVEDMQSIPDLALKAACEKRCLVFARALLLASSPHWRDKNAETVPAFGSIDKVVLEARRLWGAPPPASLGGGPPPATAALLTE
jgi:5-methylthioribose kinase